MAPLEHSPTNWHYWQCDLAAPVAGFGPMASMAALWRSRIEAGQLLPSRQSLDFPDFRGWWGRIAIARIERDPFDVRFSLWGTQLSIWWGVDYTNRRLGEAAKDPETWLLTEGRYFEQMARAPFIGIACGRLDQHDRSYKKVLGLDLPLGEDNRLTHVLAVHMEIDRTANPQQVMPDCPMAAMDVIPLEI